MVDVEYSSGLDSSNEEYDEEETQPVVTQRDVFGSDTDSEDDIPVVKVSKQKTVPADESSAAEEEADQEEKFENDDDEDLPGGAPPSRSRSRRQRLASEQSASGGDSEASPLPAESRPQKKQVQSRRSVGHNLFSDESEQEEEDVADYASDVEEERERTPLEGDLEEDSQSEDGNDVQEESEAGDVDEEEEEGDTAELDETKIAVDFPLIRSDLGKEIYLVKMPNFLSVETRPFDPVYYEDELDEDEVMDEEGRTRLKLKVENTIRWRKSTEKENVHESNARIVKWSDGSLSLHLGDEIFDIHKVDIHADYNYLFIREGSGLQGQSALRTKLTFRPHSTDSFTHRKITLSLADKTNKSQKVKILPIAGADPETNRSQLVRREDEKLRASLRRESQLRRMRERQAISRGSLGERRRVSSGSGGGGAAYEEDYDEDRAGEDEEDDGNTTSLNALKRNAKVAFKASRKEVSGIYSSDSESLSDISEQRSRKKIRATISDEESA